MFQKLFRKKNIQNILKEELEKLNFKKFEYSKGYMLSIWDNKIKKPYLRRGLIRTEKNI